MVKRIARAVARWNHRQHIKDLDHTIEHHERLLLRLPAEIRRLNELRRFHQGRSATLAAAKSTVSWTLGRVGAGRRP
jgi:hypothetical protein